MCGICGICSVDPAAEVDRDELAGMVSVLLHRGPDGEGMLLARGIGLGHRRLSIIDLEGGAQPMSTEDGKVSVVFNGEIYNYVELQAELRSRGARLRTNSDTEVLLHMYRWLGHEMPSRLNGMFAFAIWDQDSDTVFFARDRVGKKPLYYRQTGDRLVFASELKAMLALSDAPREVCEAALDDYLCYGYVPGDRCIFGGVHKLPPGHMMTWRRGRLEVRSYWDVSLDDRPPVDEREWIEQLEFRLLESVRIRLRSEVPLGVFLSGGLDSSAIVALASEVDAKPPRTYSIGFAERDFNELEAARAVARRFDTDHHELIVTDHDLSILSDVVYHLDEPFADPSALPTYYVCREARKHVTVCLSGDGGDEIFAGYTRYQQAMNHCRWDWLRAVGAQRVSRVAARALPRHVRGRGALERISVDGAARYALQVGIFSADERKVLRGDRSRRRVQPDGLLYEPYFSANRALVTALQHADQKTYLPDDILVKMDRASMQNSLEVRAPLLDYNVIEWVNGAPLDLKLRGGVTKYALRRILEARLPSSILGRSKQGFGIPIRYWFRGSRGDIVRDALLAPDARVRQWLDHDAIWSLIKDHQRGGRDLSHKIWAILVLEHWCRRFNVG